MKYRTLMLGFLITAVIGTACTVPPGAIDLPGLQVLNEDIGLAESTVTGPLRALADQAEAAAPQLDVIQIDYGDEGNVIAFVILDVPEQGEQSDEDYAAVRFDVLRGAVEALWAAALEFTPEAPSVAVALMSVRTLTTLDRGPAPVAWMLGAVLISLDDAAAYLQGPRNAEAFQSIWASDAVTVIPLGEPYAGVPNHPVRSVGA